MKFLFDLDEMDNIEKNLLAEASNRLEVGEFQIFQLSYAAWYGREVDPKLLERVFFKYLTEDQVPPWARHYARHIIELDDKGELNYQEPQFHRFDVASLRGFSKTTGILKVFAVLVIVVAFFSVSIFLLRDVEPDSFPCNFPPCINVR